MQIVDCFGTPRDRGRIHGETLRARISDALDAWECATFGAAAPTQETRASSDAYCRGFLANTSLMQTVQACTPDLFAELAGIAEGAGQPFERIAAYNLMDEQWWYDFRPGAPPPGCSLIVLPIPGGHLLAQNMDLPQAMQGSQVVLRLGGPDIPQTLLLSAAGMIGLTGANAAGVAVGVNTLLMLRHAADGLPVAFALRNALAAQTRKEALGRLEQVRHASGQHYAIVSADGLSSIECSAMTCAPVSAQRVYLHTNHPLANTDLDIVAQQRLAGAGFNQSSVERLGWLEDRKSGLTTAQDVCALFDDPVAPICMRAETHRGSATFGSVLYEMTDRPAVRMRLGGAGGQAWQQIPFAETI